MDIGIFYFIALPSDPSVDLYSHVDHFYDTYDSLTKIHIDQ